MSSIYIGLQYHTCCDEAYGALRDFGVDVKRVMVNASDGSVQNVYEQFNPDTKQKSGFRAVYDNSNSMNDDSFNNLMQQESRAPFANDDHVHDETCNH